VSFVVTEAEQERLRQLHDRLPDFGKDPVFCLVEDIISRKAWDALEEGDDVV
jgi:hypothetical protein